MVIYHHAPMKIPALPLSGLLNRLSCLAFPDHKSCTRRLIWLYNQGANIANTTLLMTLSEVILIGTTYFKPRDGVILLSLMWLHWSARQHCAKVLFENSDPTVKNPLGLHPDRIKNWTGKDAIWLMHLPKIAQEDLDGLPTSITESLELLSSPWAIEFLSPAKRIFFGKLEREVHRIWSRIHERNRLLLCEFFHVKAETMAPAGRVENLLRCYTNCLGSVEAELYFAVPQKWGEMSDFLNSIGEKKPLDTIIE